MKIKIGLEIKGFCCDGFNWHIFDIDEKGWIYSECDNPKCKNLSVFVPELGDVKALEKRLAEYD